MYVPANMKMESTENTHAFIDEFGFGLIVSSDLSATHLPFILNKEQGENGVLYSHFARANPQWKALDGKDVLIVFNGPHAYISPSWYARSPAVPTWNYAAVHVYGRVEMLGAEHALEVVELAVNKYEPSLLVERNILTDDFRDKLLAGIVAFSVNISKVEAKLKLGQHREYEDQKGVAEGLERAGDHDSLGLLNYMRAKNIGIGGD